MPPHPTSSTKKRRSPFDTSVTPQRKHRKLLKDGSGTEVWPESVEKVFVQGLKDYWKSTWATYTRGRSRWRNQFLVDYLRERGIDRTKKQVASHMQVLRNMWKGEDEFHLVAGGEELFLETGLLSPAIKDEEDRLNDKSLIPLEDGSASPPSSQGFSPASEYGSPPHISDPYLTLPSLGRPSPQPLSAVDNTLPPYAQSPSLSISSFPFDYQTPLHIDTSVYSGYNSCLYPTTHSVYSSSPEPSPIEQLSSSPFESLSLHRIPAFAPTIPTRSFSNPISNIGSPFNRVLNLSLWAEGMEPANISLDTLRANGFQQFAPLSLEVSLAVPLMDDSRFPETLYGFHGTLSINAPWCASATCLTQVYSGAACTSEEIGQIQLMSESSSASAPTASGSSASFQPVNAFLPLSRLSSCRWLESDQHTSITQEITVDGEILVFVTYNIQRIPLGAADAAPSATLTGFQKYRPRAVEESLRSNNWISTAPVAAGPRSQANAGTGSTVPRSALPSSSTAGVYGLSPLQISAPHRSTDQLPLSSGLSPYQCRPPTAAMMNSAMLF